MSSLWERVNLAIRATRKIATKVKGELNKALADDGAGQHMHDAAKAHDRDLLLLVALRDLDLRLQVLERKLEAKK